MLRQRAIKLVAILGLPSLGGLLLWAAQVGPEDAVSNLAKWARTLGVDSPPAWLVSHSVDDWAAFGGVLAILTGMAIGAGWAWRSWRTGTGPVAAPQPNQKADRLNAPLSSEEPFASVRLLYDASRHKFDVLSKTNVRSLVITPETPPAAILIRPPQLVYVTFDAGGPFYVEVASHTMAVQHAVIEQGLDFVRIRFHEPIAIITKTPPRSGEISLSFRLQPPTQSGLPAP